MAEINFGEEDTILEPQGPLPSGDYPASIYEAEEDVSSKGNDMLIVTYKISDASELGRGRTLKDYYVYLPGFPMRKLKTLLCAVGILEEGYRGSFNVVPRDLLGRPLTISIGRAEPIKDEDGNVVEQSRFNKVYGVAPAEHDATKDTPF